MREETRSEIIHDALNLLDDEMIEEVDRLRGGIAEEEKTYSTKGIRPWRKWVALAASVCVFVLIGGIWQAGSNLSEFETEDKNQEVNKENSMLNTDNENIFGDVAEDQVERPETEYGFAATYIGGENYAVAESKVGVMDFALRLFENNLQMESNEAKNILISPASVLSSLGMTSFGAQEETLSQMEKVFGMSRGNLNRYLADELNTTSKELKSANSIWFTDDEVFTINSQFLEFNKEYFQVDVFESSFDRATVKEINAWVESKTDGQIQEILNEIPENVVMYLVNALLFEAEWEVEYTESKIKDEIFTTQDGTEQQVEMMYGTEQLYLEDEHASGFMKYYKNRRYAFVALLPKENISVYEYTKSLTGQHLEEMLSNPKEAKVYSRIPQFSCEYEIEMQESLKSMGMVDLFDFNKANLNGLGEYEGRNIYVSRVLHKTFIQVTPVGTKAGAATVVEVPTYGAAPEPDVVKEVYLDRPFMYMIIDCESNQPIFMGTVNTVE